MKAAEILKLLLQILTSSFHLWFSSLFRNQYFRSGLFWVSSSVLVMCSLCQITKKWYLIVSKAITASIWYVNGWKVSSCFPYILKTVFHYHSIKINAQSDLKCRFDCFLRSFSAIFSWTGLETKQRRVVQPTCRFLWEFRNANNPNGFVFTTMRAQQMVYTNLIGFFSLQYFFK